MVVRYLAGLFLVICIAGCIGDGQVRAKGKVVGPNGAPIAGALVYLDDPGRTRFPTSFEATTEPDGSFRLSTTVAPGHYTIPLVVEADGLKIARHDIQTLTENIVEVRLAGAGSEDDSTILLK